MPIPTINELLEEKGVNTDTTDVDIESINDEIGERARAEVDYEMMSDEEKAEFDKNKEEEEEKSSGDTLPEDQKKDEPELDDEGNPIVKKEETKTEDPSSDKDTLESAVKRPSEEDLEIEVKAYAEEHKISLDEAREDVESVYKIAEKYKGDAKQLALANLNVQRLLSAKSDELSAIAQKNQRPYEWDEEKVIFRDHEQGTEKVYSRQEIVEAFSDKYPKSTEGKSESEIYEMAERDYSTKVEAAHTERMKAISDKAADIRSTFVDKLSEDEKPFAESIRPILERLPDEYVAGKQFSLKTYVTYAKGEAYDRDMAATKKMYQELGLEEARNLRLKKDTPSSLAKPSTTVSQTSSKVSLTESQKQAALTQYDDVTEAKAYELYYDFLKSTGQIK